MNLTLAEIAAGFRAWIVGTLVELYQEVSALEKARPEDGGPGNNDQGNNNQGSQADAYLGFPPPTPLAGETVAAFNARMIANGMPKRTVSTLYPVDDTTPHLTLEHKYDPWAPILDPSGNPGFGCWVPGNAIFSSPPFVEAAV